MGLHNKPASILTHGGKSEDALAFALKTRHDHHEHEHEKLYAGSGLDGLPERHMDYFPERTAGAAPVHGGSPYPRHVHSTTLNTDGKEEYLEVKDVAQHQAALESRYWSDHRIGYEEPEHKAEITD